MLGKNSNILANPVLGDECVTFPLDRASECNPMILNITNLDIKKKKKKKNFSTLLLAFYSL